MSATVVARTYTRALKFPKVIGDLRGLPLSKLGGPYTYPQLFVGAGSLILLATTRSVWARFDPVANVAIALLIPGALVFAVRKVRVEGRSLPAYLIGVAAYAAARLQHRWRQTRSRPVVHGGGWVRVTNAVHPGPAVTPAAAPAPAPAVAVIDHGRAHDWMPAPSPPPAVAVAVPSPASGEQGRRAVQSRPDRRRAPGSRRAPAPGSRRAPAPAPAWARLQAAVRTAQPAPAERAPTLPSAAAGSRPGRRRRPGPGHLPAARAAWTPEPARIPARPSRPSALQTNVERLRAAALRPAS